MISTTHIEKNGWYVQTDGVGQALLDSLGFGRTQKTMAIVDDDEDFGTLAEHIGRALGFEIDHYCSLEELGRISRLGDYEAIIVDYHLDGMSGIEIAEYLDALFPWIPAILISGKDHPDMSIEWPTCIEGFVSKSSGIENIIKATNWAIDLRRNAANAM